MEYNKYLNLSKKIIEEDKFDIKGKSKKLVNGVVKRVSTTEGVVGLGAGGVAAVTTT